MLNAFVGTWVFSAFRDNLTNRYEKLMIKAKCVIRKKRRHRERGRSGQDEQPGNGAEAVESMPCIA
jgi:hypothetical protein